MKKINAQKTWSFIGIFLICLVLSLPFYSADAMAASLRITKNTGSAGIPQFIDAKGDNWDVEALITGTNNVTLDPKDVKIKIYDNEREFSSCSDDALGKLCKYVSPLGDGVKEVGYKFQVYYNYTNEYGISTTAADEDVIQSDGSAPQVSHLEASQESDGTVHLNFDVSDRYEGKPYVGIKNIDIIDVDSGKVLQSITDIPQGKGDFNFLNEGGTSGVVTAKFTGEGYKRIKVVGEDWFGHRTANPPIATFDSDFVSPSIIKDSLNFTALGKFKGAVDLTTNVNLDILETSEIKVLATAAGTTLDESEAECVLDTNPETENLRHCTWKNIIIKGDAPNPLSLQVAVLDEKGNVVQETLTQSFITDNDKPQVIYFGPARAYDGKEYLSKENSINEGNSVGDTIDRGDHRIYLRVKEQGAGMSEDDVRADFTGLGLGPSVAPDNCTQGQETFDCYWNINMGSVSAGTARIGFSTLKDRAGNEAESPGIELVIDDGVPKLTKLEVYGSVESVDHNYFESNDAIKIKAFVEETSGVRIYVNLNELVMDAATQYPEDENTLGLGDGWAFFDDRDCVRGKEGRWECTIETPPIKSGPSNNVHLELRVTDTAGNSVSEWIEAKNVERGSTNGLYSFTLLGKSDEASPDYWEVAASYPKPLLKFVDLDTTKVTYTRMPLEIKFTSTNPLASVLSVELIKDSCTAVGTAPELSRVMVYGGNYPQGDNYPSLNLVLEFAPFDGRTLFSTSSEKVFEKATATYNCKVKIYSQVGKNALSSGETQEVVVKVPFAFSTLGALDENLAQLIKDEKGTGTMKFLKAMYYINLAVTWIKYILNAVMIIFSLLNVYDMVDTLLNSDATGAEKNPIPPGTGEAIGKALRGECAALDLGGKGTATKYIGYVQIPLQILACEPDTSDWSKRTSDTETPKTAPAATPAPALTGKAISTGALTGQAYQIDSSGTLGWYGGWQKAVLDWYNVVTGRDLIGMPAGSLYDNIYLSIIGLCVPGIVFNMDKLREIHCRKIVCLGQEVPSGIATVQSCNDLYDLLECEFWAGPFFDIVPGMSALSQIGKTLKSMMSSPVGLINILEIGVCTAGCWTPDWGTVYKACNWIKVLTKVIGIIDSVIGIVKSPPTLTAAPYCKMADKIDVDKLTGGSEYGQETTPEDTTETTPSGNSTNPYAYTQAGANA